MFVSLLMKAYKYHTEQQLWAQSRNNLNHNWFYCFHAENLTHWKKINPNIHIHKIQEPESSLPEFMKLFPSFHTCKIIGLWLELKPRHQASNLYPLKNSGETLRVWILRLSTKQGRIINLSTLNILESSDSEPILSLDVWPYTHMLALSMHSCILTQTQEALGIIIFLFAFACLKDQE